jgi:hypothetical protein
MWRAFVYWRIVTEQQAFEATATAPQTCFLHKRSNASPQHNSK